MNMISRRDLLALSASAVAPLTFADTRKVMSPIINEPILTTLGRFISGYCEAMNAPALTLGLATADGLPGQWPTDSWI